MEGLWKKIWSKSHQRDYWFNSATNEKSWSEPEEAKKERESRKRHHADVDANAGNEGIDNDNENSSRGGGKHNSIIASSTSPSSSSIPSALSSSSSAAKKQTLRPEVAIIVPYRDLHVEQKRKQHLDRFVQELPYFLSKSSKSFRIYIIEQSDDGRKFNRGKLLNIGYKIAKEEGNEVFIFHDVDLIPSENLLPYYTASQEEHPIHIARVWNRYNGNAKYFGGIVNFSSSQFEKINGFPNNFWGWGGEDDEMYKRVKEQGYRPTAPTSGSILDMEEMDLQSKLSFLKSHKLWKCMNKTEVLEEHSRSWYTNGVNTCTYKEMNRTALGERSDVVKVQVDVQENNHWTDLVCQVENSQLDVDVSRLKEQFKCQHQRKP